MDNPTVYKFPKKVVENPDGTISEIERNLRKNRDVSVVIKVKDKNEQGKERNVS